ncbi:hypothetical protein [Microvirga tunisiensis]|uniref:Secreted protein n=1 Tax=Microvirga tunisiensis TaxID=2108360 RepID=A0A5N7MJR3_9HYPH|nr:hypothetical protein [Microvirga tunisiensis]MPR08927.1 hypothetical protein [Microvirga tunisiensis]MPR27143.1 hypothetical protein [Microvirga tunisiensis]
MNTKALLFTVTAIVTVLFLSAFRVQAANEDPLMTMEQLGRNPGGLKHCEPHCVGADLSKEPTGEGSMTRLSGARCPA